MSNFQFYAVCAAAFAWAWLVSDFFRAMMMKDPDRYGHGETLIGFGLWCLFLWWLAKRYKGGWSFELCIIAIVTYAPFADGINAVFGGTLGLRG